MYSSSCSLVCVLVLFLGVVVVVCNGVDTKTTAPMEFPKNTSDYNLIQNSTILDNLNKHDVMEKEVNDMNNGGIYKTSSTPAATTTTTQSDEKIAKDLFTPENFKGVYQDPSDKEETEPIQTGNNEDERRIESGNAEVGPVPVIQGQLAAILAGVFVLIAAVGYSGLLAYRRYLENRYGSRDLLVNEEQFTL